MKYLNTKEVKVIGFTILNDNQIHVDIADKGTVLFELNDTELNGVTYINIDEFINNL